MSALTTLPVAARRPTTVVVAIVLLILLALSVLLPVPGLEAIPTAALIVGYVFAALKLVAAIGLWRRHKWAAILGGIVVFLDALTAVPGLADAPAAPLAIYLVVGLLASIAVLVLLVLPASRRAYA